MSETNSSGKKVFSILLVIILIALGLSIMAFYQAFVLFGSDPTLGGYFSLIGFMGLALLTYLLLQTRKKTLTLPTQAQKIATTILCQKCGFKNIRDFQQGDYVFKETEECPKCNKKMLIESIYREAKEKAGKD